MKFTSDRRSRVYCTVLCLVFTVGAAWAGSESPMGPPAGGGPYRASDLIELVTLDPRIKLDIRHATSNNFIGKPVYTEARAFLQRPAAEALLAAHRWLRTKGYGVVIHDGYRPWAITKLFWDSTPPEQRIFVADPAIGSRHNRGCVVDIGLYELASGRGARRARSATRSDGARGIFLRPARGMVALRLQGLPRVRDRGHSVQRNRQRLRRRAMSRARQVRARVH